MKKLNVKSRVNGYHPASGLHLVQGESYAIDAGVFSLEVFELKKSTKGGSK